MCTTIAKHGDVFQRGCSLTSTSTRLQPHSDLLHLLRQYTLSAHPVEKSGDTHRPTSARLPPKNDFLRSRPAIEMQTPLPHQH